MERGKDGDAHVFGPFTPGDSFRVYRLQRKGISLDQQRDLIQPHTPLWEAYLAFVTQHAMGQPTYVLYDPHRGEAFVQVRYRPHQAAADVTYLAPALRGDGRAAKTWAQLLDGACIESAGRGIQRVFASLTEGSAESDIFHQAGFTPYAREDVYCLDTLSSEGPKAEELALRAQSLEDWPAIQKLCVNITPQRVRQSEGGIALAMGLEKNCRRFVLPGESGEDLVAVANLSIGARAHWLRLLVHPDAGHLAEDLVRWSVGRLAGYPPRPVYCNVRQYEGGMRAALAAVGFELCDTRVLMVKHTVAWVKTPVQELVPALKGSVEPVPPAYRINGEAELQPSNGRLAARQDA
jgi:hypothetical protein